MANIGGLDIVSGLSPEVLLKKVLKSLMAVTTENPVLSDKSYKINCFKLDEK